MLTLISAKPYDEISVRDIAGLAGVSYPTFFRNYLSKADLLGEIGADQTCELFAAMVGVLDRQDPALTAQEVCKFVDERRQLWKVLLNSEAAFVMRQTFISESAKLIQTQPRFLLDFPVELSASFFVGSMFEVLSWWLAQSVPVPLSRTARYLETLVMRPTMTREP